MTEKKGFVLYFDAASSLAALCAEQRGELLLALFDYAERTAKQSLTPETALASYPGARRTDAHGVPLHGKQHRA